MTSQHFAILIPHRFAHALFARFYPAWREAGHHAIFFSHRYHLYRKLKKRGIPCKLLTTGIPGADGAADFDISSTVECLTNSINAKQAQCYARSVFRALEAEHQRRPLDAVVTFNGANVMGEAARYFASKHQVKTLFVEIGNLPGKLFADPWGTNAQSKLFAKSEECLTPFEPDMEAHAQWKADYLRAMREDHRVPQATLKRAQADRWADLFFDTWGNLRYGTVGSCAPVAHVLKRLLRGRLIPHAKTSETLPDAFLFLPLQVSNDTQLLLHGGMTNIQAMEAALSIAIKAGLKLLVKLHPAEENAAHVRAVHDYCRTHSIVISHANIFRALEAANEVVTVNSTAGLQAMIAEKPVTFLGKSLFSHLRCDEDMARYIHGYLLDIDCFADDNVAARQAASLLERAEGAAE